MKPPLSLKPVPFIEAIVHAAGRKVTLPDEYYGKLQGIERAEAFSVAGMAKLDQLQQVLDSVTKSMANGYTFARWQNEALQAPDALALPAHRLDNIFRTNIQVAYARGRCVQYEKAKHRRPYLRYSAINDARTRPHHLAMHGHVAKHDDPVWQQWTPPCGHRCRCTVISMTEDQAQQFAERDNDRLKNDPEAAIARATAIAQGPDKGWDYSPCENMDQATLDAAKEKREHYAAALQPKLDETIKEAAKLRGADDPDQWQRIGGQLGSNKGGLYEAPDGRRYYVKEYADVAQARGEVAAHKINEMLGLTAPGARIMTMEGRSVLASEWIPDAKPASIAELTKTADRRRQLARIYASAALTKNWDVAGMTLDNIVLTRDGRLAVIDAGGAFKHRAQGAAKVFAAGPVQEVASLLDPNYNKAAASVFGKLSEKERIAAIRALDAIKKSDLEKTFIAAGYPAVEVKALTEATWARKKWMVESVKSAEKAAMPAGSTGIRVFDNLSPLPPSEAKTLLADAFGEKVARDARREVKSALGKAASEARIPYLAGINLYTGPHYKRINKALRSGSPGNMAAVADIITEGLRGMPKHAGNLRRGLSFIDKGMVAERDAFILAHLRAKKAGVPVEYRGFVSTSSADGFGGDVRLYITSAGIQGADVKTISQHTREYEILFPHGSRFMVHEIKQAPGVTEIWLYETKEAAGAASVFKASMPDQDMTGVASGYASGASS